MTYRNIISSLWVITWNASSLESEKVRPMRARQALSFSHAPEFATAQCEMEILPYVQKFLLQCRQCVRVIDSYLDHWSIADLLADPYDFSVRVLISIDEVLELKEANNLILIIFFIYRLPFDSHTSWKYVNQRSIWLSSTLKVVVQRVNKMKILNFEKKDGDNAANTQCR